MFSFGLFATHIPYIVLSLLYILYLGAWGISSLFLNGSDQSVENLPNNSNKIEISIKDDVSHTQQQKSNAKSYFYQIAKCNVISDFSLEVFILDKSFHHSRLLVISHLSYLDIFAKVFNGFNSNIFSRPPPFSFLS